MGTGFDKTWKSKLSSWTAGLVDWDANGNVKGGWENPGGYDAGKGVKRLLLEAATLGTSDISTGGGEYGDETVADSLFPKSINDAFLDDRAKGRMTKDAETKATAGAATRQAASAPDLTDKLLQQSMKNSMQRTKSGQGRRSTFLTGAGGDIGKPSKKSLLGGGY